MTTPAERRLSDGLRDIVAQQPFAPDVTAIEAHGRSMARRATTVRVASAGVAVAVAAVTVGAVVHQGGTTAGSAVADPAKHAAQQPAAQPPLVSLAAQLNASAKPTGDATLFLRDQHVGGQHIEVWDLYADNGTYYFSPTRAGMAAQVAGHKDQGDGVFAREVAAAEYAATGDIDTARQKMEDAPLDPGTTRRVPLDPTKDAALIENYVWENSMDALTAGAGNPVVRAGVLRLLSTLKQATVTKTSTDGQATLTLTEKVSITVSLHDKVKTVGPSDYQEVLIINASTGVPVSFHGGDASNRYATAVDYQVTRVTLADVAAGKF